MKTKMNELHPDMLEISKGRIIDLSEVRTIAKNGSGFALIQFRGITGWEESDLQFEEAMNAWINHMHNRNVRFNGEV